MRKRMIVWGCVGGLIGAVFSSKAAYDPSDAYTLYGFGVGLLLAVAMVSLFSGEHT